MLTEEKYINILKVGTSNIINVTVLNNKLRYNSLRLKQAKQIEYGHAVLKIIRW